MDSILGFIVIALFVLIVDKIISWHNRAYEKKRAQLEVLKVVSKHECFGLFKNDLAQFEKWLAKLLALKGFKVVEVTRGQKDSGKDIVVRNNMGQTVYVECKLSSPEQWDTPVDQTVAQKLVGAMLADSVRYGLIITTGVVSDAAKDYLNQVNKVGYQVKYIDGDALVKELYDLREAKLPEILESIGIKLKLR